MSLVLDKKEGVLAAIRVSEDSELQIRQAKDLRYICFMADESGQRFLDDFGLGSQVAFKTYEEALELCVRYLKERPSAW